MEDTPYDPLTVEVINALVLERHGLRARREFERADELHRRLREEFRVEVIDSSSSSGETQLPTWRRRLVPPKTNIMDIVSRLEASAERGAVALEEDVEHLRSQLHALVSILEVSADGVGEAELQGRMYSDVAFRLALAGVADTACTALLTRGAVAELRRFGHRNSCRVTDIYHIVERLACAGSLDQTAAQIAADLLAKKIPAKGLASHAASLSAVRGGAFNLLCDGPLLLLWTYSSHQHKSGKQFNSGDSDTAVAGLKRGRDQDASSQPLDAAVVPSAAPSGQGHSDGASVGAVDVPVNILYPSEFVDISKLFSDPSLPLVIDLGCGYGVSILGLCYDQVHGTAACVGAYNYLGCDMSPKAVRYGRSIARQWNMESNIAFVCMECAACLEAVRLTYIRSSSGSSSSSSSSSVGGPVLRILAQFPTPFALGTLTPEVHPRCFYSQDSGSALDSRPRLQGNSQLPTDISGFMITEGLISKILAVFDESRGQFKETADKCLLYVQSNIEDVAVFLRDMITSTTPQFEVVGSIDEAITSWGTRADGDTSEVPELTAPRRQEQWRASGGLPAEGPGWLSRSPLPLHARTETELLYARDRKPVHRALFMHKEPPAVPVL